MKKDDSETTSFSLFLVLSWWHTATFRSNVNIEWYDEKSLCIVLCSKGYPDKFEKNIIIENIDQINLNKNEYIYHAGTTKNLNKIYSNGGRVLNFVTLSNSFRKSQKNSIDLIKKLNWSNGFYRKDIGYKVINS